MSEHRGTPADSATSGTRLDTLAGLALEAAFDGGRLTSDGGLPWLRRVDDKLDLCQTLAAHVPEWRARTPNHSMPELIRQRVYQIACGYEDQNDSDTLREDPLLKLVCDRLPESDSELASQPTISPLENAATARSCYKIAAALGKLYLRERGSSGDPGRILLDFDSTDDPAHGQQEGTHYHGYFEERIYHPLLVFDGDTDQLVTAVLRPGNAHASHGALAVLKRIVRAIRESWPDTEIEIRADAGFAILAFYEYCETEGIDYTIGLISNPRLEGLAEDLLKRAGQAFEALASADGKIRLLSEASYQAGSWDSERRVVYKAEIQKEGANTRFVVTSRADTPEELYDWYVMRGEAEGWIKDFKRALKADRLSCRRFWANQFRLLLHAAAYWLLDTLRGWLMNAGVSRMQLDTLRLRLIKIGGRVRQILTKVCLHLASGHPGQWLWNALERRTSGFP